MKNTRPEGEVWWHDPISEIPCACRKKGAVLVNVSILDIENLKGTIDKDVLTLKINIPVILVTTLKK